MQRRRIIIVVLLFLLSMINYIDRITLSFAIGPVAKEFGLSDIEKGYLFSSFLWTYAACVVPAGVLVDKYGSKRVAGWGLALWSAATAMTGLSAGFVSMLVSRLLMGAGEASSNPAGGKAIREWIPSGERGFVTAAFNSGSYAGPALCALVAGAIIETWGWRSLFFTGGAIGMIWLAFWLALYGKPESVSWLSQPEREKILLERHAGAKPSHVDGEPLGLRGLLSTRTMWGLALAQGCNVYCQYLFLTWLPSYLQAEKHLTLMKAGLYTAIPYGLAVVFCILVGRGSDRFLSKHGTGSGKRRNVVACSMAAASLILFAPMINETWLLLALITIALTGTATTTSMHFALLNDLLPNPKDIGRGMGIIVVVANLFGFAAPIVTGYVVSGTGNYAWAFIIAGSLLATGALIALTMTRRPIHFEPALA